MSLVGSEKCGDLVGDTEGEQGHSSIQSRLRAARGSVTYELFGEQVMPQNVGTFAKGRPSQSSSHWAPRALQCQAHRTLHREECSESATLPKSEGHKYARRSYP